MPAQQLEERITYDGDECEFRENFTDYHKRKCQKYSAMTFESNKPELNVQKMLKTVCKGSDSDLAYIYWLSFYCSQVANDMIQEYVCDERHQFSEHMAKLMTLGELSTFRTAKGKIKHTDKRKYKQFYIIFIGVFLIKGKVTYVFKIGKTERGYQVRVGEHYKDVCIPDINMVEVYQVDEPHIVEKEILQRFKKYRIKSKDWLSTNNGKTKKRELLGITDMNVLVEIMECVTGMQRKYNTSGKVDALKEKLAKRSMELKEIKDELKTMKNVADDLLEAIRDDDKEKIAELQELLAQMAI